MYVHICIPVLNVIPRYVCMHTSFIYACIRDWIYKNTYVFTPSIIIASYDTLYVSPVLTLKSFAFLKKDLDTTLQSPEQCIGSYVYGMHQLIV